MDVRAAALTVALGIIGATAAGACHKGSSASTSPPPATVREVKQVNGFLGQPVSTRPAACDEEETFTDDHPFKTITCKLSDTDDLMVLATYLDDSTVGPENRGRLLDAYAIMKRPLSQDDQKLSAFLAAFQEKYGPFIEDDRVDDAARPDVRLCNPTSSGCRSIFASHNANKQFSSRAFAISLAVAGQGAASFDVVSIWDKDLATSLGNAVQQHAEAAGKALVK